VMQKQLQQRRVLQQRKKLKALLKMLADLKLICRYSICSLCDKIDITVLSLPLGFTVTLRPSVTAFASRCVCMCVCVAMRASAQRGTCVSVNSIF
jgi:uncharacterized Fe-S radical SAM superfamily protein PflX